MKKSFIILTVILITLSLCMVMFMACTPENENPGGSSNNTSYKVSTQKDDVFGDYYSLRADKSLTTAGNTVNVTVSDLWDFLSVDKVFANEPNALKAQTANILLKCRQQTLPLPPHSKSISLPKERTE